MTKHRNTTIALDALRILNNKGDDQLPDEVLGPVAIIPITRYSNYVKSASGTDTTQVVFAIFPSGSDVYLNAIQLWVRKTAGNTATKVYAYVITDDGVTNDLCHVPLVPSTAQAVAYTVNFDPPIKVMRSSVCVINCDNATATIDFGGSMVGYSVDTTRMA